MSFFLFISLRCTHRCEHCGYGCSPDRGEDMSLETFFKGIREAERNGIRGVTFFGGEPFVNPNIFAMIRFALDRGFDLEIETNCKILENANRYKMFLGAVGRDIEKIRVTTSRDRHHLKIFDPREVVSMLERDGFSVQILDYTDRSIVLTEHIMDKVDILPRDHSHNCCDRKNSFHPPLLPDGSWSLCPPSLVKFSNIDTLSLADMIAFKRSLPMKYHLSCTECIKDYPEFTERLGAWVSQRNSGRPHGKMSGIIEEEW